MLVYANTNKPYDNEPIDGLRYPLATLMAMQDEDLAALGLMRPLPPLPKLADTRSECERRILAVASRNTQSNLNAYINGLNAKVLTRGADALSVSERSDIGKFFLCMNWINDMRAACVTNIDNPGFQEDTAWPAVDADLVEFAKRF